MRWILTNILQRSSVVIHDGNTMKTEKSASSSFSKASFVVSSEDSGDVDVADPDFWKKVVGVVQDEITENEWDRSSRRRKAAGISYREPSFRAMLKSQIEASDGEESDGGDFEVTQSSDKSILRMLLRPSICLANGAIRT